MDPKSLVLQQLFEALLSSAPMLAMNMLSQTDRGRPIQTGEIIPNDGVSFAQYPNADSGLADFADMPKTEAPFLGQGILEDGVLKRVISRNPTFDTTPGDYDMSDLVIEADPYADSVGSYFKASENQLPVMVRPHKNTAAYKKSYAPRMKQEYDYYGLDQPSADITGPESYEGFVDSLRRKRGLPELYRKLDDDLPF